MNDILVTGATGTVGRQVLRALQNQPGPGRVRAAVRDVAHDRPKLADFPAVEPVHFDFDDAATFGPALAGVDRVFLLRPPQLADVDEFFRPFVAAARAAGVRHVVFLSVQGAEDNPVIPHHKIEKLLQASGLDYTFLRPAYFMQNFLTTLRPDLVQRHCIYLPAGHARFTLVDVRDIGAVAAVVLREPAAHAGRAYPLTSATPLTFGEMAVILSQELGHDIGYESPNLLSFFLAKKREGLATGFILVMMALHFLPRFQRTPPTTDCVQQLTGRPPHSFTDFVRHYRARLGAES